MSMVKKSISVTSQQADWVKSQINSGQFGNESEVFRELIRERIKHDSEIQAIRAALIEGERSGPGNRDIDSIWQQAEQMLSRQNA